MKNSLIILACLIAGILVGILALVPKGFLDLDPTVYALNALLFLVGAEIGANTRVWQVARSQNLRILLVPLSAILGTLLGVALFSVVVPGVGLRESLAVGSGFGYYTLASVLIAQLGGKTLGVVALLSNIMREMATLLAAPLMARYFGRLAPIVSGGATSMDTTLPIITRSVGTDYAVISVVNGVVLTLLAPVLITAILG
ncbi:MAG: lysine exporter LysO family protein [Candidatus Methylomirabilales bacterium]